jgi:hypothetical protein
MTVRTYSDAEIADLLDESRTSLVDLYRMFSAGMPGNEGFGSNPVAKAKDALRNMMGRIRREVCPRLAEPQYRRLIDSGTSSDAISLVAVLASLLASLGFALNSTLVAVLLIRMGIRTICPAQL